MNKGFFLVYGPYASGKTHLAIEAYRIASSLGYNPVIIATEPGTSSIARLIRIPFIEALNMDELLSKVTLEVAKGRYPVIDSINWHYRENPGPVFGRYMAYISALLLESGGFATAQVSGELGEASGSPYLLPWASSLARTRREGDAYILIFERPLRRILGFRIRRYSIEWI